MINITFMTNMEKGYNILITNCAKHTGDAANVFCHRHCQTLCTKCLLDEHRECVHGNVVEDVAKTLKRAEKEFPDASKSYGRLVEKQTKWAEHFKKAIIDLESSEERLTNGLKQMRLRLIEQMNKLATEALEMVHSVTGEQRSMVQHNLDKLGGFGDKLSGTNRLIDESRHRSEISIGEAMLIVNTLAQLENEFKELEINNKDTKLSFFVSQELQHIKDKFTSFGELCIEDARNKTAFGKRNRSNVSLVPSDTGLFYTEDDEDVFVMPKNVVEEHDGNNLYCYISAENRSPCTPPPAPPPIPETRPRLSIPPKQALWDTDGDKFKTLPRGIVFSDTSRLDAKIRSNSFGSPSGGSAPLSIPPLPKKRVSRSLSSHSHDSIVSTGSQTRSQQNLSDSTMSNTKEQSQQIARELDSLRLSGLSNNSTLHSESDLKEDHSAQSNSPKIAERPPTLPKPKIQNSESRPLPDPRLLSPSSANALPKPHKFLKVETNNKMNTPASDSKLVVKSIPALPKKRAPRRSIFKAFTHGNDSSESSEYAECHSDNEITQKVTSVAKTSSFTDLTKVGTTNNNKDVLFYGGSDPSMESASGMSVISTFSSGSSSSSVSTAIVRKRSIAEHIDQIFPSDGSGEEDKQKHMVTVRSAVIDRRKSRTLTMTNILNNHVTNSPNPVPDHSLFTGLAVTQSGQLVLCDFENNCVQLFDASGVPLFHYRLTEPFSCCLIREELVAVTSKNRKTMCIFDTSSSRITCVQEQLVAPEGDVFGIGYAHGFFGIACGDRVAIFTEKLQLYRTVKPIIMVKKKRSKPFFNDIKYVALDWSAKGFYVYTSEHKMDRVSCVEIGNRDKPVWFCHVGKPKSLLLSEDKLLVAAKGKIVILQPSTGHRMKEIHHDVPSHPIHMVQNGTWLYITKNSTANAESRNIRRIPMV